MKILHIGDMHIGCRLENNSRNPEIRKVLDFLHTIVKGKNIEAVLIAGDVFDNGQPSVDSQNIYYNFLLNLKEAGCRQIIVIAGNHDNPNFLDAPKWLLQHLEIHVIGNVDNDHLEQEVIPLGDKAAPCAYVCAVPYLKPRDLYDATAPLSFTNGVAKHYNEVWKIANEMRNGRTDIPIIGMGHLYATGSSFIPADTENIVGKLEGVELQDFAGQYDYMALGHIHFPQEIAKHNNWRYAGSILPMKIQKNNFVPQVILLDTQELSNPTSIELPDNCFHKMAFIEGKMDELRKQLNEMRINNSDAWIKAVYTGEEAMPNWSIDLRLELQGATLQIVETETRRNGNTAAQMGAAVLPDETMTPLSELQPINVYDRYMKQHEDEHTEEQRQELRKLYLEAQDAVYSPEQQQEKSCNENKGIMKFKRLYIKNVNSLYGENEIDFESPEFNNGIFLISGPTGAGKSSILDAICLALYGSTPRMTKGISEHNNPVMSIGQSEMKVSLTFSIGNDEYCATFEHRTKKKGCETPYAQPKHSLSKNGKPISDKIKETEKAIIELIGLKEEQFTQCVLLAQGRFNEFLKSNDRSGILSQITGTEIYRKIGNEINRRHSEIKKEREVQNSLMQNITILPEEEVVENQAKLKEIEDKQKELAAQIKACEAIEQIFENLTKFEQNIQQAEAERKAASDAFDAANPERDLLSAALRAQLCENEYIAWAQLEQNKKTAEQEKQTLSAENKKLCDELATAAKIREDAGANWNTLQSNQLKEKELFQNVRALDLTITNAARQKTDTQKARNDAKSQKEAAEKIIGSARTEWQKKEETAAESEIYLKEHQADKELAGKIDSWELRRKALCTLEAENVNRQNNIDKTATWIQELEKSCKSIQQKIDENGKKLTEQEDKIKSLTEKKSELLAGKSIDEINELWAAAGKLQDFFKGSNSRNNFLTPGKPCPLCGSTSHPYCDGTAQPEEHDYSQDIATLKQRLDDITVCDKNIKDAEKRVSSLNTVLAKDGTEYNANENNLKRESENLQKQREELLQKQKEAADDAARLADELKIALQIEWRDHSSLPKELPERIKKFNNAQAVMATLDNARQEYSQAEAAFTAVDEKNSQTLANAEQNLQKQTAELEKLQKERRELFGDKDVNACEQEAAKTLEKSRKKMEDAAAQLTAASTNLDNNKKALAAKEQQLVEMLPQIDASKKAFEAQLAEQGFTDDTTFLNARMEPEQLQKLQGKLTSLDTARSEKESALQMRIRLRDEEKAKLTENVERQQNLDKCNELKPQFAELNQEAIDIKAALQNNEDNTKQFKTVKEELLRLEALSNNWSYLNNHFGNNGGKDFERIAQGYTFTELLACANKNRLSFLKNHFTLINDKNAPLELYVIDHYRGDNIRSAVNLSGGEQFEVSLALALGLADMSAVSQNASLGNVLLDEGFGTLDDEALDSALDLLSKLNSQDGKLVGIISHVAKLEEKIETQISVTTSGGMGTLSGAGVITHNSTSTTTKKRATKRQK